MRTLQHITVLDVFFCNGFGSVAQASTMPLNFTCAGFTQNYLKFIQLFYFSTLTLYWCWEWFIQKFIKIKTK